MLEQLLRNEQDTRILCGVVLDTCIVPNQLCTPTSTQWAGLVRGFITEGTKLGEMLAWLSDHMEELNRLSIEEKCKVVEHCRSEKSHQPLQRSVTLAEETLHLRCSVGKALETLKDERKRGGGPRTALARELEDWFGGPAVTSLGL